MTMMMFRKIEIICKSIKIKIFFSGAWHYQKCESRHGDDKEGGRQGLPSSVEHGRLVRARNGEQYEGGSLLPPLSQARQ